MKDITSIPSKFDIMLKELPTGLIKHFGCLRCEWRHTSRCFVVKSGSSYPSDKICKSRLAWVYSLLPDYENGDLVNHDRLSRDILLSLSKDYSLQCDQRIRDLDIKIKDLESDPDTPISKLDHCYKEKRNLEHWRHKYLQLAADKHDSQVGRETTKKVDITKRELSPRDVFNIFRGDNVKDAEVYDDKE